MDFNKNIPLGVNFIKTIYNNMFFYECLEEFIFEDYIYFLTYNGKSKLYFKYLDSDKKVIFIIYKGDNILCKIYLTKFRFEKVMEYYNLKIEYDKENKFVETEIALSDLSIEEQEEIIEFNKTSIKN